MWEIVGVVLGKMVDVWDTWYQARSRSRLLEKQAAYQWDARQQQLDLDKERSTLKHQLQLEQHLEAYNHERDLTLLRERSRFTAERDLLVIDGDRERPLPEGFVHF